ncbi:MAG: cell division protein ZapA [Ruminococcus sp.]|nr:cell division protein ZapA [Ruminococcus sp.]
MNKHTVFIAGKRFVLVSDEKEAYVQSLASEVNNAIAKISEEIPALESKSCAVLCALNYADERNKEYQRNRSLSGNAKTVIDQADKQGKQLREMKEKLSRAEETVKALNNHNVELERSHKQLSNENELLRKKIEELNSHIEELKAAAAQKDVQATPVKVAEEEEPKQQISLFDNE